MFLNDMIFTLSRNQIATEPWFLTRIIANAFGFVIDFLFNLVYAITPANSLAFAIILLTVLFRFVMLPLTIKSQKSMMNMRKIQPELKKIDEKYGKTKDPEIMKKIQMEKTALMAKHDANPLKGCLPMLIQMPLFLGLIFIMNQAFLYITTLRNLYYQLAERIIAIPGIFGARYSDGRFIDGPGLLDNLSNPIIPDNMQQQLPLFANLVANHGYTLEQAAYAVPDAIAISYPPHLARVINRFIEEDWAALFDFISTYAPAHLEGIMELFNLRAQITTFMGLSVTETGGWGWPGIVIPILVGVTMFLSTYLSQLRTADPDADDKMKMQQKMMLIVMPIVLAVVTVNFPIAVGIYWISSQIFGVVQDIIMNIRAGVKFQLPFVDGR